MSDTIPPKKQQKLLRLRDVQKRIPVSRTHWYRGIKSGNFPPPYKLGPMTAVWAETEIDELIEKLIQGERA